MVCLLWQQWPDSTASPGCPNLTATASYGCSKYTPARLLFCCFQGPFYTARTSDIRCDWPSSGVVVILHHVVSAVCSTVMTCLTIFHSSVEFP